MKTTPENDTITPMMFLVFGFQTLKHVNLLLSFRATPAQEANQEFDHEVLTPAPQ